MQPSVEVSATEYHPVALTAIEGPVAWFDHEKVKLGPIPGQV